MDAGAGCRRGDRGSVATQRPACTIRICGSFGCRSSGHALRVNHLGSPDGGGVVEPTSVSARVSCWSQSMAASGRSGTVDDPIELGRERPYTVLSLGNRSMAPLTSDRHAHAADTRVARTRSKQRLGDPRPRHLPVGPVASTRDNLPQQPPRRVGFPIH